MSREESWHLDKRVPIGIIFAVLCQTAAFIWFLSGIDNRVTNNANASASNKAEITSIERNLLAVRENVNRQEVTLGRIDVQLISIAAILERLEKKFD